MGVLGLWQLLAPVGQPVSLESLENKILAVDVSIWLNQAIKGYRDAKGGSVANAHLLSLFSRLCKLLYYKIRPIVVFDGGVPELKKQTIINRQHRREALRENSHHSGLRVLAGYLASQGLQNEKDITSSPNKNSSIAKKSAVKDDIFILPPLEQSMELENSLEDEDEEPHVRHAELTKESLKYLTEIDIESKDFQELPLNIKQEILSTLQESRKYRHWTYYEQLPKESKDFSSYQMQCLLKRRKVQSKLEEVNRDLQKNHYVDIVSMYENNDQMYGEPSKIMSDDFSHYVYLKKINELDSQASTSALEPKYDSPNLTEKCSKTCDEVNKLYQENILFDKENDDELYESDNDIVTVLSTHNLKETPNSSKANTNVKDFELIESQDDSKSSIKSISDNNDITVSETHISVSQNKSAEDSDILNSKEVLGSNLNLIQKNKNEPVIKVNSQNDKNTLSSTCKVSENASFELENKTIHETELSSDSFHSVSDLELENSDNGSKINQSCANNIDESKSIGINVLETNNNDKNQSPSDKVSNSLFSNVIAESSSLTTQSSALSSKETLNNKKNSECLKEIRENFCKELEEVSTLLQSEQAKQQRQANTVQEHMVEECKDLLRLFGVPYVVSPMEAEAQCAFYDLHELTHGTITDDSDIWLFGGRKVYKNFFSQQKYVEFYQAREIISHFNLDRKKLICFAMLTGSDYTEGIENVGPVTAMEILSEFMGEGLDTLVCFKQWWELSNKHASPPKNKVRAKLRKLVVTDGFPNNYVYETYLNPKVDESVESFSWGLPDLDALRDYSKEKFGWSKSKVDDFLLPVIKRLNERTSQTHLDNFFTVSLKKEKNLFPSKRIQSALKKINPSKKESDDEDIDMPSTVQKKKSVRKRPLKTVKSKGQKNIKTKKCNKKRVTSNQITMNVVPTVLLSEESSDEV